MERFYSNRRRVPAKIARSVWLIYLVLFLGLSLAPISESRNVDVPSHIECQVCGKLASELYQQVEEKLQTERKIALHQVNDIAKNVCNLKKSKADWKIDFVEKLELVEPIETIEKTCQKIMRFFDTDDVARLLYKKAKVERLETFLCNHACSEQPSPVPKDRIPGEPFTPKSEKEAEMERKSMQVDPKVMPWAPGEKMHSTEELMNQGYDEEDDKINLKQALQDQKANTNQTWKEKAADTMKSTVVKVKSLYNNASIKVRQCRDEIANCRSSVPDFWKPQPAPDEKHQSTDEEKPVEEAMDEIQKDKSSMSEIYQQCFLKLMSRVDEVSEQMRSVATQLDSLHQEVKQQKQLLWNYFQDRPMPRADCLITAI